MDLLYPYIPKLVQSGKVKGGGGPPRHDLNPYN